VVTYHSSGISLHGHANYAEPGKDIVCAGVSTLVQTLIQSVEELTADKIQYSMQPGTVDIEFRNLSEQAQLLVDSFFVGISLIAGEYPDNVKLTKL
jgi:uncharacterized protein YsxB (DUF464 family)